MTSKGCAFLMDMGTGKTITTIALAGTLHHRHKITQMLVVCPKSIVDVWEQEFEKFADFPYQLAVLDGTSAKKADTIRYMIGNGLQIIVVNYESCWRLEAELTRWHPDMIVCDESSKIKNPQAKCSKALHRLGKISSYNLILTGTPITNSPLDFWRQLLQLPRLLRHPRRIPESPDRWVQASGRAGRKGAFHRISHSYRRSGRSAGIRGGSATGKAGAKCPEGL